MTLAQVQAAVAVATLIVVSWMALVLATALAFPVHTTRAGETLEKKPLRSLWIGVAMATLFGVFLAILQVPNPLVKLAATGGTLAIAGLLCVGGAGLAKLFGNRIGEMAGAKTSFGELTRGCLVYSVAMAFPYVGWFLFAPIATLCALGAGTQSVLRRSRVAAKSGLLTSEA